MCERRCLFVSTDSSAFMMDHHGRCLTAAVSGLLVIAMVQSAFGDDRPSGRSVEKVSLTVVYDNRTERDVLTEDWGFACVVDGFEKRILFDTGAKGDILLHNLRHLEIDPASFDIIVISHAHWDHVGGLGALLLQNKNARVVLLESFPSELHSQIRSLGGTVLPVTGPTEICPGVRTGGEMGTSIKEQALVLDLAEGLVVLTGCSHPGICHMLEEIKEREGKPILLVLGGFHLMEKSESEMEQIMGRIHSLGVRRVAPCHCTGEEQIQKFRQSYGERFIDVGVGALVSLP